MLVRSGRDTLPVCQKEENGAARKENFAIVRLVKFCCLGTRLFCFFRQEFFDRARKIKFRFFLVAVGGDF
jgi:hypothetical protein